MLKKIKEFFKSEQEKAENDLVDKIIRSMRDEPELWVIDEYCAHYGQLCIWIANSPYADMTINDRRLPRRGELRKALAFCAMQKFKTIFK
jgi:hypothetical protein